MRQTAPVSWGTGAFLLHEWKGGRLRETDRELAEAMLKNHRVAIPREGTRPEAFDPDMRHAVGMLDMEYLENSGDLPEN